MTTNTAPKRSRASVEQLNQMVDFMFEWPGLAEGKFQKLHGKLEHEKKWRELASLLNSLGGAVKSVDQWHTVWRDLKSRTSIKVRDRKRQQAITGNKPLKQEFITELERRIITIIGNEHIEGDDSVSENVPLEEELQQMEMKVSSIYKIAPTTYTTEEPIKMRSDTPIQNTSRKYLKRKRVEDDSDTWPQFLEIANKQADALKMLAESNAAGVETAKNQAEALKVLAECSKACVQVNKMMAEALTTIGEGLRATAQAFNNFTNALDRL